ncbi:MAG: hypothetical protein A2359_03140 [Candidatus Moranbacteria bacterium RIFOXYB1_FULL_43_19]|nr:MAG: hypothetical protein A2359_03140 [Candidatus Moranbacteria bacterium RIFOXYB1_FULL_43_19]OGI28222.1 MAG: hypothetical protein A2184_03775 [Candidatus Moranbacteria bacterium RIFOXYA1_FULL_44_7]OGI33672.1 MAG: hypothetical protein A2420_02400 [Candidatus Moranbacteria bacterium RIFOXYC1_FULL_44_13]
MIMVYEVRIKFKGSEYEALVTQDGRRALDRAFTGATDDLVLSEFLNYLENQACAEKIISVGTSTDMQNTMDQRVRVITRS